MRPSTLSAAALMSGLALAQNNTSTSNTTICTNQDRIDIAATGHINSTGTSSFVFNSTTDRGTTKPWYMSVMVNNSATSGNRGTIAWPYLSVPEDTDADVCIYSFDSQNATATGDNCAGVFSNKCIDYLRDAVRNASSSLGRGSSSTGCNIPPQTAEQSGRQWEACGPVGVTGVVPYKNVANKTCAYNKLSGVDLPDGYVTKIMGISASPFNDTAVPRWDGGADDAYDLIVVQAMSFAVVSARERDNGVLQKEIQFVCVTPNNTQPGSRVPEDKTPWPESGASVAWSSVPGLSGIVAGVTALMLFL